MPHPPLKLLRASAGSGKTFSLVAHYLTLLFSGAGKYREILAVTFTNKATAEMKERILNALQDLANGKKTPFTDILKAQYPLLADEEISQKAAQIYRSILHDYSRFSVSTIDGFVQQVIRSFAFELNLDSGYKLEMNQEKVKDALVKALDKQMEKDPELLKWVTGLAMSRIDEGQDWNYRKALNDLANEIFKERYYPFQEAMLLLGEERSNEFNSLKEIAAKRIKEFKEQIVSKTSALKQMLDQSGILPDHLNRKTGHPILKLDKLDKEEYSFIRTHLAKLIDDFDQWPNRSLADTRQVQLLFAGINPLLIDLVNYYSEKGEEFHTLNVIQKNSSYLRLMQEMADLLKNYRAENKVLLISDAQQLLKGVTSSDADNPSFIWEKTGTKYKHFLFDEFQDTSTFQWINFLPLVKNALAESRREISEHLVVGDVKQSIYRWRNGDWRILHSQVKIDLKEHNLLEENLEFNRRSTENIIRFNNMLFSIVPDILQNKINEKITEEAGTVVQQFWEEGYNQIIAEAYFGSTQNITEQTPSGGEVRVDLLSKDEEHEEGNTGLALEYTQKEITRLLTEKKCRMKDICILVRSNREATLTVQYLLRNKAQISPDFQVISGEALKIDNNPAVQLLVSAFRLLVTRDDENSIIKSTCARLYYEVHHPQEEYINISPEEWMLLANRKTEQLADLFPGEFCSGFASYKQWPVTQLAEEMIKVFNLGRQENEEHSNETKKIHTPYILAFRDQVAQFAAGGDRGLKSFIEWWDEEGCKKALPASVNQDAVNVMTIHKSKGLEFKSVIIPFCDWSLSPPGNNFLWVEAAHASFPKFGKLPVNYNRELIKSVYAKDYFEEMLLTYMDALNTLYVATTRAVSYLYIISAQKGNNAYGINTILKELLGPDNPYQHEFYAEDGKMVYGESYFNQDEKTDDNLLDLEFYPVNKPLAENFLKANRREDVYFNLEQRKGVILHALLSEVSDLQELDKNLEQKIQEGLIRENERTEFRSFVNDILSQENIKNWFTNAERVISEKDMVIAGGHTLRPDKLFVTGDHAVLLDFKFGEENKNYIDQLNSYRNNLLQMGEYQTVDAYIWYANSQKLQKV